MIEFVIQGPPTSWKAHQGYGNRAYNPRQKEKDFARWQIRSQYNQRNPLRGPIRLTLVFHLVPPKTTSSVRKRQMLNGLIYPVTRPDLDNYNKFFIDCLKEIVMEDDNQVVEIHSKKIYSEIYKSVIQVESMDSNSSEFKN